MAEEHEALVDLGDRGLLGLHNQAERLHALSASPPGTGAQRGQREAGEHG